MSNKIFNLFLMCAFIITSLLQGNVIADESVCFTCHQYPGLVRQNDNKKDGLKIFHIDKEKYRASSHGHLDCMACHLGINKIPHVGKNKTSCQSGCHKSSRDKKLLATTPRKGFHIKEQSFIANLEDKTSCKVCHQIYPHTKEPFVRTLLNMHTGYLVCEVCHLDRSKFTVSRYGWVQTKEVYFQGEAFGSFYDPLHKLTKRPESTLSRIAPFVNREGELQALMNTWDTDGAIKVCSSRTRLGKEEKALEISHYHRDVVKMKHTTACEECHSANGLIDFQAIGFSKERSDVLINLDIGNIIKQYEVFYMPDL